MLSDAHCHYDAAGELAAIHRRLGVPAIVNCGTPAEWHQNQALIGPAQTLSFGIHPWASATADFDAAAEYFAQAPVIGEIGLDRVWTDVPQAVQLPVFERQLALAQAQHKPVVLHTKGCEEAVLKLIRQYPNRYFVHWYSDAAWQDDYLTLGCYMSIGVDVVSDPAVQALAKRVPAERLLLESDGVESLTWAWGRPVATSEYPQAMQTCAARVAALRQADVAQVTAAAAANLARFIG